MEWFQRVWQSMSQEQQMRVRDKAKWEHVSLRAVLESTASDERRMTRETE